MTRGCIVSCCKSHACVLSAPFTALLQTGLEKMSKLRVIYASNNKIREWAEIERLKMLPALEELLLAGNPLHTEFKERGAIQDYRLEVGRT